MKIIVDIKTLHIEGDKAWVWTSDIADELYSQTADFLEANLQVEITYKGQIEAYEENLEIDFSKWESKEGKIFFNTRELD